MRPYEERCDQPSCTWEGFTKDLGRYMTCPACDSYIDEPIKYKKPHHKQNSTPKEQTKTMGKIALIKELRLMKPSLGVNADGNVITTPIGLKEAKDFVEKCMEEGRLRYAAPTYVDNPSPQEAVDRMINGYCVKCSTAINTLDRGPLCTGCRDVIRAKRSY